MQKNMGDSDRIFRLAAGLATAAIGHCPAYLPFGLNTCKSEKK
jgi:hypothetical protein